MESWIAQEIARLTPEDRAKYASESFRAPGCGRALRVAGGALRARPSREPTRR